MTVQDEVHLGVYHLITGAKHFVPPILIHEMTIGKFSEIH